MDLIMQQNGFALTEALISLLVISIGLLGLATLQLNALKHQQESEYRLMAVNQIDSMADRMRSNPVAISNGNYNNINAGTQAPNCSTCTPAQIAQRDGYEWNLENAQYLPSGQGQIVALGTNVYDITIRWDARKTGATGKTAAKHHHFCRSNRRLQ